MKGKIEVWEYYLGFLPFVSLIGAIIELGKAGSDFPPPKDFVKDPDDDEHVYREQKLNLPDDPNFGKMVLRGAQPLNDPSSLHASGLYLFGALEIWSPPQPELQDPEIEPFEWGKGGHCSRRVTVNANFGLYPVNPQHWALLRVCEVRVIDDPLNVFKVRVDRELHGLAGVFVEADFWAMSSNYWKPQYRYPCRLMIKTTGGVRIVTFPPLAELTEDEFAELYKQIQFEYVNECYLPRQRLFEELEWPIEVLIEQPGLHNWQVRAAGLEPREQVQLVDERAGVVARFTANWNGTLLVNALGNLHGTEPTLRLRRGMTERTALLRAAQTMRTLQAVPPESKQGSDPEDTGSSIEMGAWEDKSRGVVIRQTQLAERGRIGLAGQCLYLSGDMADGLPRVIVVTPGVVETYDVSDANAPRLAGTWYAAGVQGALQFGDELLLWGEPGMWAATDAPPARTATRFAHCEPTQVRSAVKVRDQLCALRADELLMYGPELCEQGRYGAGRAMQLAAVGDFVVLRDPEGLRVFDSRSESPEQAAVYSLSQVNHIETPSVSLGCDAVYVRGPEGALSSSSLRRANWNAWPNTKAGRGSNGWLARGGR